MGWLVPIRRKDFLKCCPTSMTWSKWGPLGAGVGWDGDINHNIILLFRQIKILTVAIWIKIWLQGPSQNATPLPCLVNQSINHKLFPFKRDIFSMQYVLGWVQWKLHIPEMNAARKWQYCGVKQNGLFDEVWSLLGYWPKALWICLLELT